MTLQEITTKWKVPTPEVCEKLNWQKENGFFWNIKDGEISLNFHAVTTRCIITIYTDTSKLKKGFFEAPQLHDIPLSENIAICKVGNEYIAYAVGDATLQYNLNNALPNENVFETEIEARLAVYEYFKTEK